MGRYHPKRYVGKNDRVKLSQLGQFIRDVFHYRVEVEWAIIYDDESWRISRTVPHGKRFRTPDLMVFGDENRLICCIELDGSVHDTAAFGKTLKRNAWYKDRGISLIVINEGHMARSMFDEAHRGLTSIGA